ARVERSGAGSLPIGPGNDLLDPGLGGVEPGLAMAAQALSPLVEPDRFLQWHVTAFELADHVFQRAQRLLEAHRGDVWLIFFHGRGLAAMPAGVKQSPRC